MFPKGWSGDVLTRMNRITLGAKSVADCCEQRVCVVRFCKKVFNAQALKLSHPCLFALASRGDEHHCRFHLLYRADKNDAIHEWHGHVRKHDLGWLRVLCNDS